MRHPRQYTPPRYGEEPHRRRFEHEDEGRDWQAGREDERGGRSPGQGQVERGGQQGGGDWYGGRSDYQQHMHGDEWREPRRGDWRESGRGDRDRGDRERGPMSGGPDERGQRFGSYADERDDGRSGGPYDRMGEMGDVAGYGRGGYAAGGYGLGQGHSGGMLGEYGRGDRGRDYGGDADTDFGRARDAGRGFGRHAADDERRSRGFGGPDVAGVGRNRGTPRQGPKGYQRSDERIKDDVCERLMQQDDVELSEVSIEVRKGKVMLEGTVPERRMKHRIEDIACSCMGVQDIENHLRVGGGAGTGSGDRSGEASEYGPRGGSTASH